MVFVSFEVEKMRIFLVQSIVQSIYIGLVARRNRLTPAIIYVSQTALLTCTLLQSPATVGRSRWSSPTLVFPIARVAFSVDVLILATLNSYSTSVEIQNALQKKLGCF